MVTSTRVIPLRQQVETSLAKRIAGEVDGVPWRTFLIKIIPGVNKQSFASTRLRVEIEPLPESSAVSISTNLQYNADLDEVSSKVVALTSDYVKLRLQGKSTKEARRSIETSAKENVPEQ